MPISSHVQATRSNAIAISAVAVSVIILAVAPRFANPSAADLLPREMVGVWTSDGAVLSKQGALFEGQALYLRPDGRGAMIGGPPPIGVNIVSTFNSATNTLTIRFSPQNGHPCREISIAYDPQAKSLNPDPVTSLRRHLDNVPAWLTRDFDRSPTSCSHDHNKRQ